MKKWIPIVIVIGMLGMALYDFIDSGRNSTNGIELMERQSKNKQVGEAGDMVIGVETGNKAPDLQLQTLTGDTVKLSDFHGKRVMINFWATWCPPCRAEMPDMEKLYRNKDIVILAVNLTNKEKGMGGIEKFVKDYKLTFPVLLDKNSDIANLYEIKPIPTSYMIDSNGIIRYKVMGAMNYDLMVQEYEKMR